MADRPMVNDGGENRSATDAEIAQLEKDYSEFLKIEYQLKRQNFYPNIQEQLDMIYWDKKNGTKKWEEAIDKVKTDNPKPE